MGAVAMRAFGSGSESLPWVEAVNESVEQVSIHETRPNADMPRMSYPTRPPDSYFLGSVPAPLRDAMKWAELSSAVVLLMHHTSRAKPVLGVLVVRMCVAIQGG